jgi:hypothetical protein
VATQRTPLLGQSSVVTAKYSRIGAFSSIGVLQGLNLGGPQSPYSSSTYQCLMVMVTRANVEGTPGPPCLALIGPTMFHFRWSLHSGDNTLSIKCKQEINADPRPTVTVKANSSCQVYSDVVATAAPGTGWVMVTVPVTALCTVFSSNAVIVELRNNYIASYQTCYWDDISTT